MRSKDFIRVRLSVGIKPSVKIIELNNVELSYRNTVKVA